MPEPTVAGSSLLLSERAETPCKQTPTASPPKGIEDVEMSILTGVGPFPPALLRKQNNGDDETNQI